jgi:signal recognition particle subunit SRP54
MGDVLTLIDKAKEHFDEAQAEEAANRLFEGQFTLEDFLEQMQQVKKMGPLGGLIGMLPGMPKELRNAEIDDKDLGHIEAIIKSMTVYERRNPDAIDGSRRQRIADGSGTNTSEVNALLRQFKDMQRMMKRFMPAGPKKGPKGRKAKKGGRVTAKGMALPKGPKTELKLPGLN